MIIINLPFKVDFKKTDLIANALKGDILGNFEQETDYCSISEQPKD